MAFIDRIIRRIIKYFKKIRKKVNYFLLNLSGRMSGYDGDLTKYAVCVSYPRSGSHWLRVMLELYYGRPVVSDFLTETHKRSDVRYWRSGHDMLLDEKYDIVFYIYRNPIDTLWSLLNYYKRDINKSNIDELLELWIKNLEKWIFDENFTKKKYIVRYDSLVKDTTNTLEDLINWLSPNHSINKHRVRLAVEKTSKKDMKSITTYNPKVINRAKDYSSRRDKFKREWSEYIWSKLPERLRDLF